MATGFGGRLGRAVQRGLRRPAEVLRHPGSALRRGRRGKTATGPAVPVPHPMPGEVRYRPYPDDRADPGEVVWGWVPFDEGDGRGKDRPVLVIGRRGGELLGLLLSSQDHDLDADDEARHGRYWMDIGSGAWDPQGRPSEVRLDRVLLLDPASVRREGAALDRARFDRVVTAVRELQGW